MRSGKESEDGRIEHEDRFFLSLEGRNLSDRTTVKK
jgi:hypothetical protein